MGLIQKITRLAMCRHNTICLVIFTIRSVVVILRLTRRLHESYSARWTGDAIASGLSHLLLFWMWEIPVTGMLSCQFLLKRWLIALHVLHFLLKPQQKCVTKEVPRLATPGNDAMQVPLDEDLSKARRS